MKRQQTDSTMTTRVYSYGSVPARIAPVTGEEHAIAQMKLGNRLWNGEGTAETEAAAVGSACSAAWLLRRISGVVCVNFPLKWKRLLGGVVAETGKENPNDWILVLCRFNRISSVDLFNVGGWKIASYEKLRRAAHFHTVVEAPARRRGC